MSNDSTVRKRGPAFVINLMRSSDNRDIVMRMINSALLWYISAPLFESAEVGTGLLRHDLLAARTPEAANHSRLGSLRAPCRTWTHSNHTFENCEVDPIYRSASSEEQLPHRLP